MAWRKEPERKAPDGSTNGNPRKSDDSPKTKTFPWCSPGPDYDPGRLCCPHCGCPGSTVTKTTHFPGHIRRYRICLHCEKSFRTREIDDNAKPKRAK